MPEPHDSASNTVERNGPSPDGGQIGALVMALAVAGAVALFSSDAPIGVPGYGPGAAIAREPTALAATGSGGSARPGAATGGNVEADMGAAATGSGDTPSRAAVRPLTAAALPAGTETAAATVVTGTVPVTAIDTAAVADVTATPPVTATRASDAAWAQLNSLAPLPPPSSPDLPLGLAADQPPFFSLARPFGTGLEDRASRYYPYGTTGGGEYLLHHGVDIGNPIGTPVLVVADGIVEYAGSDDRASDVMWGPQPDFYGQLVVVRHDNLPRVEGQAISTLYGHLSRVLVAAGQEVRRGDAVGEVGMTGIALGPHLHLETRLAVPDYGSTRNPELFLEPRQGVGTIVGRLRDTEGRPLPNRSVKLYAAAAGDSASPGAWLTQTTTYPGTGVNAASGWNENLLFGDVEPGEYVLVADIDGGTVTAPVSVSAGKATIAELEAPASR